MSGQEDPARLAADHEVTVEDVRALMGASTPHFALQIRDRIHKLVSGLPPEHPARIEGEREIVRLQELAVVGEVRGADAQPGMETLKSVTDEAVA